MKTAALHNLGCKVNAYETESMEELLINDGYTIVPFTEKADVYVINTCTVTSVADQKSRQMISRAKRLNPDAVVVAAGCYVQTGADRLIRDHVADIIIGNNRKNDLIKEIHDFLNMKYGSCDLGTIVTTDIPDINRTDIGYEEMQLHNTHEHTRAFLKIQDGCNQFCSYCLIPYARGRVRSRAPENILKEAQDLASKGFKEFVLTGIHLTSYGLKSTGASDYLGDSACDSSSNPSDAEPAVTEKVSYEYHLIDLIEKMSEIEGVERIRLGSLEPRVVTEEFTRRLSAVKQICPHFHLSLQSGSDAVLKRMNRHYSAAEYADSVRLLRKYFDDPAITTDVICGFPGETEEEFKESRQFVEDTEFYEMHVFPYSIRQGTRAAGMTPQIKKAVKKERTNEMVALSHRMTAAYIRRHLGKTLDILLEEPVTIDGTEYWTGFSKEYIRVLYRSDENLQNTLIQAKVTDFITTPDSPEIPKALVEL